MLFTVDYLPVNSIEFDHKIIITLFSMCIYWWSEINIAEISNFCA
jgi:hypothetical protein